MVNAVSATVISVIIVVITLSCGRGIQPHGSYSEGVKEAHRLCSAGPSMTDGQDYTVLGLLGKATDDFREDGRLVERTTYDHVTREKLDRILAVIQGSHQKALVTYSNLDLQTQEAYEMAVKGLIRPMNKSPMLVTGIRCLRFAPPEFLLEVQCMNETQKQLRSLVHEIGLELKTTAVCSHVRRTRDGCFTLDDALLRTQWNLNSIQDAMQAAAPRVAAELEKNLRLRLGTQQLQGPGWQGDNEGPSPALEGRTAGGAAVGKGQSCS
uniref:TruB pseudouridine synthase family member 2 n=1 Tax=Pipistrellus kuhlii TaxID=59472 RepID=A0A7J7S4T5_PIPKU|nr:TruB pseudouridine synthase family member 2 [Pipistrellus kuhlii]